MCAAYFFFSDTSNTASAPSSSTTSSEVVAPSGPISEPSVSVPQGEPEWIEIGGVLGKTNLHPGGVYAGATTVEPVDNQPVWWADSELPGTDSPGTTFILGHNYSGGDNVPFAALEKTASGDSIQLGTVNGALRYQVTQVLKTTKSLFSTHQLDELKDPVPGRLVLMTCDTENGHDTYDNFVVVAQLSM